MSKTRRKTISAADEMGRLARSFRRTRLRHLTQLVVTCLVLTMASLYLGTSGAAYFKTSSNPGDNWRTGLVDLTDNDAGSALFTTSAGDPNTYLDGGQTVTKCINVTYTGDWKRASFIEPFTNLNNWWMLDASKVTINGSGALELSPDAAFTSRVTTNASFDFNEASVSYEIIQLPGIGESLELGLYKNSSNSVKFRVVTPSNTPVMLFEDEANGVTSQAEAGWSQATMRYLRIMNYGDKNYFQTSPDRLNWTTQYWVSKKFNMSPMTVGVISGYSGSLSPPLTAIVDNVAVTPNLTVKSYAQTSDTLIPYLTASIDQGTGATDANCTGFTLSKNIYNGPVANLGTNFDTGVGDWAPSPTQTTLSYRISLTNSNDAGGQGKTGSINFHWEARM